MSVRTVGSQGFETTARTDASSSRDPGTEKVSSFASRPVRAGDPEYRERVGRIVRGRDRAAESVSNRDPEQVSAEWRSSEIPAVSAFREPSHGSALLPRHDRGDAVPGPGTHHSDLPWDRASPMASFQSTSNGCPIASPFTDVTAHAAATRVMPARDSWSRELGLRTADSAEAAPGEARNDPSFASSVVASDPTTRRMLADAATRPRLGPGSVLKQAPPGSVAHELRRLRSGGSANGSASFASSTGRAEVAEMASPGQTVGRKQQGRSSYHPRGGRGLALREEEEGPEVVLPDDAAITAAEERSARDADWTRFSLIQKIDAERDAVAGDAIAAETTRGAAEGRKMAEAEAWKLRSRSLHSEARATETEVVSVREEISFLEREKAEADAFYLLDRGAEATRLLSKIESTRAEMKVARVAAANPLLRQVGRDRAKASVREARRSVAEDEKALAECQANDRKDPLRAARKRSLTLENEIRDLNEKIARLQARAQETLRVRDREEAAYARRARAGRRELRAAVGKAATCEETLHVLDDQVARSLLALEGTAKLGVRASKQRSVEKEHRRTGRAASDIVARELKHANDGGESNASLSLASSTATVQVDGVAEFLSRVNCDSLHGRLKALGVDSLAKLSTVDPEAVRGLRNPTKKRFVRGVTALRQQFVEAAELLIRLERLKLEEKGGVEAPRLDPPLSAVQAEAAALASQPRFEDYSRSVPVALGGGRALPVPIPTPATPPRLPQLKATHQQDAPFGCGEDRFPGASTLAPASPGPGSFESPSAIAIDDKWRLPSLGTSSFSSPNREPLQGKPRYSPRPEPGSPRSSVVVESPRRLHASFKAVKQGSMPLMPSPRIGAHSDKEIFGLLMETGQFTVPGAPRNEMTDHKSVVW